MSFEKAYRSQLLAFQLSKWGRNSIETTKHQQQPLWLVIPPSNGCIQHKGWIPHFPYHFPPKVRTKDLQGVFYHVIFLLVILDPVSAFSFGGRFSRISKLQDSEVTKLLDDLLGYWKYTLIWCSNTFPRFFVDYSRRKWDIQRSNRLFN